MNVAGQILCVHVCEHPFHLLYLNRHEANHCHSQGLLKVLPFNIFGRGALHVFVFYTNTTHTSPPKVELSLNCVGVLCWPWSYTSQRVRRSEAQYHNRQEPQSDAKILHVTNESASLQQFNKEGHCWTKKTNNSLKKEKKKDSRSWSACPSKNHYSEWRNWLQLGGHVSALVSPPPIK